MRILHLHPQDLCYQVYLLYIWEPSCIPIYRSLSLISLILLIRVKSLLDLHLCQIPHLRSLPKNLNRERSILPSSSPQDSIKPHPRIIYDSGEAHPSHPSIRSSAPHSSFLTYNPVCHIIILVEALILSKLSASDECIRMIQI